MTVISDGSIPIRTTQTFGELTEHLIETAFAAVLHKHYHGISIPQDYPLLYHPIVIQSLQLLRCERSWITYPIPVLADYAVGGQFHHNFVGMNARHIFGCGLGKHHSVFMVKSMKRHVGHSEIAPHGQFPVFGEIAGAKGLPSSDAVTDPYGDVVVQQGFGRKRQIILIVYGMPPTCFVPDDNHSVLYTLDNAVRRRYWYGKASESLKHTAASQSTYFGFNQPRFRFLEWKRLLYVLIPHKKTISLVRIGERYGRRGDRQQIVRTGDLIVQHIPTNLDKSPPVNSWNNIGTLLILDIQGIGESYALLMQFYQPYVLRFPCPAIQHMLVKLVIIPLARIVGTVHINPDLGTFRGSDRINRADIAVVDSPCFKRNCSL